ncbi:hypothetical protein KVR01_006480 [Diaporthe batatas]|uniref:uncharacterized protein n=1 Tax=Diaporthe batatas TaxID=748121 RepID=UPI001D057D9D|nr:uncharacterized protein KVR01_006480 [Diaporthe batatas]KAG8164562.1 hypothetical protein KVR01_006480 [Diaporthe batatas]
MGSVATISEAYGAPLVLDKPPCLWEQFQSAVAAAPEALALACVHQRAGLFGIPNLELDSDAFRQQPYLRWSLRSLNQGIDRLVRALQPLNVRGGTPVVTFCHNSAEYVLVAYASIKLGCVIIPINPRNLTNEEEVRYMVRTGLSVCNGDRPLVAAGDEHLAFKIDELGLFPQPAHKVVFGAARYADWTGFPSLMDEHPQAADELLPRPSDTERGGCVLFTSGTTSLPKGIYRLHRNWAAAMAARIPIDGVVRAGDRSCSPGPNNHIIGFWPLAIALSLGAGVIYPGLAFDPDLMLETLYNERISHVTIVPTMLHALVAAKATKYPNRPMSDLKNVTLAGAPITPEILKLVTQELGGGGAEHAFGCTEGLLIFGGCTDDFSKIIDGDDAAVGWPMPGFGVRIADPDTGEVVPHNTVGEIHGCGPSIDGPYIGGMGKENWYESDGKLWYKTGDAGRMDSRGRTFITGRFKDMIIRGGENISPAAVESILCKNPMLNALMPQIVGVRDEIAGEVPICVIKGSATTEIRQLVQSEIVNHMGTLYVPEDVIPVKALGLEDYPRTTSGKIQKVKLAALVKKHLSESEEALDSTTSNDANLTEQLRSIWAKAVGLEPSRIRLDAPTGEFADSITVMRVRDKIMRATGRTLSLAAMTEAGTIEKQVKLLLSMGAGHANGTQEVRVERPTRKGPPGVEDMVHLIEEPDLFEPTKELVNSTLSSLGMDWEDVEDIIPAYDFGAIMSQTKLYDSWNLNTAIHPSNRVNKEQLRRAFEAVVINNRILASFFVWDSDKLHSDDALHVVVRQSPKFFDMIVEDGGSLDTAEDLKGISLKHPRPDYATLPGPAYRTMLFDVKETGTAAMVTSAHHCVIDGFMAQSVHEDLDRALAAIASGASSTEEILAKLHPHVDYKPWADSYYNLRSGVEARAATKWHLRRLSSLRQHVEAGALFPPTLITPRGQYNGALVGGDDRIFFMFDTPDIHALRKEHPDITPQAVVKSAAALMNVHRTGHSHAVFTNHEASRTSFPFVSKTMVAVSPRLFEATDVSGPTYHNVINLIEVRRVGGGETVLGFLRRVQAEQTLLTKHSAAPMRKIMDGLEGGNELVPELIGAQVFNWVPGMGTMGTNPHHHHEVLSGVIKSHLGLSMHCGLGGPQNQTVIVRVRGDGFEQDGLRRIGEEMEAITKWLVTRGNWEVPVGDFERCLEG